MRYEWKKQEKKRPAAFINGALLILAGGFLFLVCLGLAEFVTVLGFLFILYAIISIPTYLIERYNSFEDTLLSFLGDILALFFGILLVVSPGMADVTAEKVISVWLIFTGTVYLINVYTYARVRDSMWIISLIITIIAVGAGICTLLYIAFWDILQGIIIPVYLIVLGIVTIAGQFSKKETSPHIPLPMTAEAFLPFAIFANLNTFNRKARSRAEVKSDTEDDIEIFIHLSRHPSTFFGHVDIAFEDYVLSYGPYDMSKESKRLFGLVTDGVLVICSREEYIDFSINDEDKTIFGYKLSLDEHQKKILKDNTKHLLDCCVAWEPNEKDKRVNRFSRGVRKRGAHLYKVTGHRFEKFSALSTNCALLAEVLLKGTGVPLTGSIGGIVLPGAMLSLLDKEFYRKGSLVAAKNEYTI